MNRIFLLAGCLGLAVAAQTQAQSIVDVNFPGYLPPNLIDLDGDGQADFSANGSGVFIGTDDIPQSFISTSWNLSALTGGHFSMAGGGVENISIGTVIDANSGFWSDANTTARLADLGEDLIHNISYYGGVLAPGASGLVALQFVADDGYTHYGWMRFRMSVAPPDPSMLGLIEFGPQIAEFAWDTIPNESITAGEVPEPTTLALLAAGVAFYIARRK